MTRGLLKIILLVPLLIYSQRKLDLGGEFKLIIHQDSIKIFTGDELLVFDKDLNKIRESEILFDPKILDYEIFENKDSIYFVSIKGGLIYTLNSKGLFNRIDKSFNHKMQSDSPIFIKNDTIFKFGGYGFWSMRNFITYFDLNQSEWFPLNFSNTNLSEGYSNTFFLSNENDFYFFGGNKMDGFFKLKPNHKIFHFSNVKKEWNEIGKLDTHISLIDYHFINDSSFYIINESFVTKVDVLNKTISNYKKHRSLYKGLRSKNTIISDGESVFFITKEDQQLVLNKLPLKELLGEQISERSFQKTNYFYLYLLIGFLLIVSLLMIKRKKTNELIKVSNQELLMGRKKLEISKFQYQLINILIDNNRTVNKDFDILNENDYLNKYHFQRNLKNEILQINLVFKTLTSSNDDMIIIKKDEVDKRINIYQLNEHYNFSLK